MRDEPAGGEEGDYAGVMWVVRGSSYCDSAASCI